MKNTKEKDRQTQVKIVFALMNILLEGNWLAKSELKHKLSKKGYKRCEKTIYRLIKMLKNLGFNIMIEKSEIPYRYKANRRRPFV